MKYMLLIWEGTDPEADVSPEERQASMTAYMQFTQEVVDRGLMQAGDALQGPGTATTVRLNGSNTITTDGPFAETKEWLAGYYLLDCKDLDEAVEMAAKIPAAAHGAIEVRPIMEIPPEFTGQG
ncbi:MAG: YciI family protein [Actinomycetota bacterium]